MENRKSKSGSALSRLIELAKLAVLETLTCEKGLLHQRMKMALIFVSDNSRHRDRRKHVLAPVICGIRETGFSALSTLVKDRRVGDSVRFFEVVEKVDHRLWFDNADGWVGK